MLYHTLLELYLAERLVDAAQEGQAGGAAAAAEVEPQVGWGVLTAGLLLLLQAGRLAGSFCHFRFFVPAAEIFSCRILAVVIGTLVAQAHLLQHRWL